MKKVNLLSMLCIVALSTCAVFSCTKNDKEGVAKTDFSGSYVDLGLPSGTMWKDLNESTGEFNLYSYDQAIQNFGENMPTKEQFEELQSNCMWTWTGNGYKIVGPNNRSIVLPAEGYRNCSGNVMGVGSCSDYWSSTADGSDNAWHLTFNSGNVNMYASRRCYGCSVRLVQNT